MKISRKCSKILTTVLSITLIGTQAAGIYAAPTEETETEIIELDAQISEEEMFASLAEFSDTDVVTDVEKQDGSVIEIEGALNPENLEAEEELLIQVENYMVSVNGEEILEAELHDFNTDSEVLKAAGGYYSVHFTVSAEDNTKAFVTGLTAANLEKLQKAVIESFSSEGDFKIEDVDFIDAEKEYTGDSLMCWAATTSNMLQYSGWAAYAGFESTDDVFEEFIANWKDDGYWESAGAGWFIDGSYGEASGPGKLESHGTSGGYAKEYCSELYTNDVAICNDVSALQLIQQLIERIENDYAIGINVEWLENGSFKGIAHAVTCWGYVVDEDYGVDDMSRYLSLIISNSDDDIISGEGMRRTAPNTLNVCKMEPYELDNGTKSWIIMETGFLSSFAWLAPWSEELVKETAAEATCDKTTTMDLVIADRALIAQGSSQLSAITEGSCYELIPTLYNVGDVAASGTTTIHVKVVNKESNETVIEKDQEISFKLGAVDYEKSAAAVTLQGLKAGDYTICLEINPDHSLTEAYYGNNTYETELHVDEAICDTENMTIEAGMPQKGEDLAYHCKLTYSDELKEFAAQYEDTATSTLQYKIYSSDLKAWGEWNNSMADVDPETIEAQGLLPDEGIIFMMPEMVRFRLIINVPDHAPLIIESPELMVKLKEMVLSVTDNNTDEIYMENGAKKLPDGNVLEVTVANNTFEKEELTDCELKIYASGNSGNVTVIAQESFDIGGEEEKTFTFSEISYDDTLYGSQYLRAEVVHGDFNTSVTLGVIKFKEAGSAVVNFTGDEDPYDGFTSFTEAVKYADETGETVTFEYDDGTFRINETIGITKSVKIEEKDGQDIQFVAYGIPMFSVSEGASLEISGSTITGGMSDKGGVLKNNGGNVRIDNCKIVSGVAEQGGAIYSSGGSVSVSNTRFERCVGNQTENENSGLASVAYLTDGAKAEFKNCEFAMNTSLRYVIYNEEGDLRIIGSSFIYNTMDEPDLGEVATAKGTQEILEKEPEHVFTDVSESSYYCNAVYWALANNVTTGTSATTFSPEKTCTRAEFVTFLWRANGCPEPETTATEFTDINEGSYYYKAVLWAVEKGITTGTSETTFDPKGIVTRKQAVTFLWRAAGKPAAESAEDPFTDVPEGSYYHDAVLWAVERGVTKGTGSTFMPDSICTRAQNVTFIYRDAITV